MGHSFLHEGPCLAGLSPAIVHVVFCGDPEVTTVTLEDCPDLDVRTTIQLVCYNYLKYIRYFVVWTNQRALSNYGWIQIF